MTDEEFQRKMDFIVDHQAQFASDIQQLREVQAKSASDIQQLREAQAQFAIELQQLQEGMHQLVEAQAQTNQVVARLANVTAVGFKDVTTKIDALVDSHIRLTEAQSRTDENLRNLIAVVDRYFREGRNGESRR